jgi:hypothetical protein
MVQAGLCLHVRIDGASYTSRVSDLHGYAITGRFQVIAQFFFLHYIHTTQQNMQGIQRRHEVHTGSARKGHQIRGQQTDSRARVSTIL